MVKFDKYHKIWYSYQSEVNKMAMHQEELSKVRASVRKQLGSRVKIRQDEGRHRTNIREGILQSAYPCVFTVLLDHEEPQQLLSFSYTDIITQEVRMSLC